MLEQHLGQMQSDLSVTNVRLQTQERAIVTTVVISFVTIIILIIAAYLTYRFSGRVRERIKFIWGVMDNLKSRIEEHLPHIPFRNTIRRLLLVPLKMLIASEKKKEKSERSSQIVKRPRLRAIRHMVRKDRRRDEPSIRWSDLHRDTVRENQAALGSHTYVTLEGLRMPQPQTRYIIP
jgi:hypothetical protein